MKKKIIKIIVLIIIILFVLGVGFLIALNSLAKRAKNAAFSDAGIEPSSVKFVHTEFDFEYGTFICEVDFISDGTEYEYLVKAFDGTIIKKEYEINATSGTISNKDAEARKNGTGNINDNNNSNKDETSDNYIGVDNAKSIAVSHAGFSVSDVSFSKAKLETDDGQMVYEVDFYMDGKEYEYTIHATSGTILEYDMD